LQIVISHDRSSQCKNSELLSSLGSELKELVAASSVGRAQVWSGAYTKAAEALPPSKQSVSLLEKSSIATKALQAVNPCGRRAAQPSEEISDCGE
jgi:hypothetical protein